MADDDQPGYMPTVDVVAIVHDHFNVSYVRRIAKRNGYAQFNVRQHPDHALTNAMALEITCREILDAQRWLIARSCEPDTGPLPALRLLPFRDP